MLALVLGLCVRLPRRGSERRGELIDVEQIQEKWKPLFRPDTGGETRP
jgi:hypothetical protein